MIHCASCGTDHDPLGSTPGMRKTCLCLELARRAEEIAANQPYPLVTPGSYLDQMMKEAKARADFNRKAAARERLDRFTMAALQGLCTDSVGLEIKVIAYQALNIAKAAIAAIDAEQGET